MSKGTDGIFHDIQEFEELSANFALNSNLLQVDKGVPTIWHNCVHLENLILRRLRISHAMVDGFRIRDGWTTFVVTPALGNKARWNGVQSLPDALGIVRSEMDHEVLMPAGWSTIEIDVAHELGFVSPSRFAEQYRRHFGHSPSMVIRHAIACSPNGGAACRQVDGRANYIGG